VAALEREVTPPPGIDGAVLRYGHFYAPGTGRERAEAPPKGALHVDAAAHAAVLAVEHGHGGIYNIAEDDGDVVIEKARTEFGFDPAFRLTG
jgi:nucleoside-diphosphate-sugar epimerase